MKTAYGCCVVDAGNVNITSGSSQSGHTAYYTALKAAYASNKPIVITGLCNGASGARPLSPAYATVYQDASTETTYHALVGVLKITVTSAGAVTVATAS